MLTPSPHLLPRSPVFPGGNVCATPNLPRSSCNIGPHLCNCGVSSVSLAPSNVFFCFSWKHVVIPPITTAFRPCWQVLRLPPLFPHSPHIVYPSLPPFSACAYPTPVSPPMSLEPPPPFSSPPSDSLFQTTVCACNAPPRNPPPQSPEADIVRRDKDVGAWTGRGEMGWQTVGGSTQRAM